MHAFDVVHRLRHMQIARKAAHGIGFVLMDAGHADDPVDHFLKRLTGGIVEIGVEAERDVVGCGLRPRHLPAEIFVH